METFTRILLTGARHRLASLLAMVAVSLWAVFGLQWLSIDTSFNSLIAGSDPDKPVYDRVLATFGSDNKTVVYVRDAQLWTPKRLADLERLHQKLEDLPFVERVDSLFNARVIRFSQGQMDFRALLSPRPEDPFEIARARENATRNPLLSGKIISPDGTVAALTVSIREDRSDDQFDRKAFFAMESLIEERRKDFEDIFQVGAPRVNVELKDKIFDDLIHLAPLSALVLVVTIVLFLRSAFAALIPLTTSLASLMWTFGVMGWFGIPINVLTAMLPSLVLVIGSTEDTHLLAAYLQGVEQEGTDRRKRAVEYMMRHLGVPMFLTVLTTCLGFFSNILSGIDMIRDFAISATMAIFFNGIATVLIGPMILSTFGPTRGRSGKKHGELTGLPGVLVGGFEHIIVRHPNVTLTLAGFLMVFFLYYASSLHVTNDPLSYFQDDQPLVVHTQRVHEDLAGMKVFFISLESATPDTFKEPENLRRVAKIQEFLDKQGAYDFSISLTDILKLMNREFHKGQPSDYKIPESRDLVEQYLLFFSRHDLSSFVNADFSRMNVVVRHNISDSHTLNGYITELKKAATLLAGAEIKAHVVGENLMVNAAAEGLMTAQIQSIGLLLAVIFVLMSLVFTSLKGGVISIIPNAIPIIMIFGVMGLLDIPINPGTAMVAVIAIGIAIDDTIHLLSRYNEECRRTSDRGEAVKRTVRAEAIPVITTSFSLTMGFSVLLFSNFSIIAQFGALSAATMIFALVADLLITPILVRRVRLVGLAQILALNVRKEVLEHSPLFQDMTPYQVKKAILISELKEFAPGRLVVRQGAMGRSMALILSGSVEVVVRVDGKEKQLAILTPGHIFGEIGFVRATRRTANVRALDAVEVLVFDYHKMRQGMKFFPHISAKLNLNISRVLGDRLAEMVTKKE